MSSSTGGQRRSTSTFTSWRSRKLNPKDKKTVEIARTQAKKVFAKNVEHMKYDQEGSINASTTGSITHLTPIPTTARAGEQIKCFSMFMRYTVTLADATNIVRVVLFSDKESNGSVPSVANILAPTVGVLSPMNADNRQRFKVHHDSTYALGSGHEVVATKVYKRYGRVMSTTLGATTPRANHLYLLVIDDSNAASHPTVEYFSRLSYSDA